MNVAPVIELVSNYSLFFLAGGALILSLISMYIGTLMTARQSNTVNYVTGEIDAMADRMREAERIGHFGSFLWNFEDASQTFWTEEIYSLLDLDAARTPPTPEQFLAFADKADADRVAKEWQKILTTSGPFSFTFRAISKKGRLMQLRVQGKMTPKRGALEASKVEGVITDVTKEMEVDRAKTEFVSLASHQLKTPLTSISWLAEALLRGTGGKLTAEQENYVSKIMESSGRMSTMVNDLLNVSRIETDTLAIRPETVDAVALMTSVIDEQRHAAEEKGVALTFTHTDNIPTPSADPQLLRMIFQNLLSNAIKYTGQGGAVACDMSPAEAGREMIFLSVKDSGIGIPKKDVPHIFEKLVRASNAQSLVPDGTGLGLYLVKTILDRVGGGITFESEEGKGTTFYATIPLAWKESGNKPLARA